MKNDYFLETLDAKRSNDVNAHIEGVYKIRMIYSFAFTFSNIDVWNCLNTIEAIRPGEEHPLVADINLGGVPLPFTLRIYILDILDIYIGYIEGIG
jgi:hypothetical protein